MAVEEVSPQGLKAGLEAGEEPVLLDVREPWEHDLARIEGSVLVPLGELPQRASELDPRAETVAICHHGTRSLYAAQMLMQRGFRRVLNLEGGIDAYADVDESIPRY